MINECASRPSADVQCRRVWRPSSRPLCLTSINSGGKVLTTDAGWSSSVARRAHNPEVAGSNPVPATRKTRYLNEKSLRYRVLFCSDKAESLCYSLPFVRTHSRRRGGGGGLSPNIEDYHPTPLRGVRLSSLVHDLVGGRLQRRIFTA